MTRTACQAVNHPYLVIYSPTSSSAAEHAQKALDAKAAAGLCPLCHDPFEVSLRVPCRVLRLICLAECICQAYVSPTCHHQCVLQRFSHRAFCSGIAHYSMWLASQDPVSAECGHAFCRGCIGEYTASAVGAAKCPSCAEPLTINFSATTTVRTRRLASTSCCSLFQPV